MQTATNPNTGETAVLVGGKWEKAESIASNDKGEKAYLVRGEWLADGGKANLPNPNPPVSVAGVAAEGAKGLVRGAAGVGALIGDAVSNFAGPAAPLVRRGIRALSAPSMSLVQPKPENDVERFAGTAGEITGGSVAGGGAGSVRAGVMTGLSALSGATGEQMAGETGKVVGAVLPAVLDIALTAGRNIPKNIVARSTRNKLSTPYARQGENIAAQTGIPLSAGQQSGDEAIMLVEGMSAKNPFSSGMFQKFGANQVRQSVTRLNKIMDDITPEKITDIRMGQIVNSAFDDAVNRSVNARRAQASVDFGAVDAASKNAAVVGTRNLLTKIDELVQDFSVPGGGDATASLVKRMESLKREIAKKPAFTANETNRLLQVYTNASSGKGQIFKDLETGQQRLLAGRLKDALLADLDEAATQGPAAALLRTARDNYKANSQAINKLEESVIGKYLGQDRSPERIADFIVKAKPTELKQTLDMVNKTNPEILPQTRRYFIERALEQATIAPSKRNPSSPNFSAAKFIDSMPEGTKFEVVFGSSNARQELKLVGEALERIAYRGFTEGSPTAPLLMAWDATKKLFTIQGLAGLPAAAIAPRTVARAALTPEGRRALITLGRYDKPTQTTIRAAGYLAGLSAIEQKTAQQPTARTEETAVEPLVPQPTP